MLTPEMLPRLQQLLADADLDGWLLYDFRGTNAIASGLLGFGGLVSRRVFALIPRDGLPIGIAHAIEPGPWAQWPKAWPLRTYSGWRALEAEVASLVQRLAVVVTVNSSHGTTFSALADRFVSFAAGAGHFPAAPRMILRINQSKSARGHLRLLQLVIIRNLHAVADGFLQFFFNFLDRCHGFSSQPPPALDQAMLQLPQYGSSCINQQLIRLAFVQTFACGVFKFRPVEESEK